MTGIEENYMNKVHLPTELNKLKFFYGNRSNFTFYFIDKLKKLITKKPMACLICFNSS